MNTNKPTETVADFKHRIAIIMRERETGKRYSIIGAARSHDCVVRKTKTYGNNTNTTTTTERQHAHDRH
jgi:hypothetical protein